MHEKIMLAPYRVIRTRSHQAHDGTSIIQSKLGEFIFEGVSERYWAAILKQSRIGLECQRIAEEYEVSSDQVYHDLLPFSFQLSEAGLLKWKSPKMKTAKVAGLGRGIYVVDDFLSSNELAQLKSAREEDYLWHPARVVSSQGMHSEQRKIRDAKALTLGKCSKLKALNRRITIRLRRTMTDLYQISRLKNEPLNMVHYNKGGFYKPHRDCFGKDNRDRIISSVVFLNDDYIGGHLRFNSLNLEVRPRKGRLVVFPSVYLHEARELKKGEKSILVTWARFQ